MPAKLSSVKKWQEAQRFREAGMTNAQLALKYNCSEKTVEYWFKQLRKMEDTEAGAYVKSHSEMEPEVLACLEDSPEGFERFFNRYSGFKLQPIHKKWVHDALSSKRTLVNCPPRHAKSEIFSVWFPIWRVCMDRNVQILICSETDAVAKKMTNKISFQLAWNTRLIEDFGEFVPMTDDTPWRPQQGQLMVAGRSRATESGDLTIQVRGAGQAILGFEANWIIVDDPVSRSVANSETERARLSEWFHGDVMTRLEPESSVFVIGQRLHMYDLYGELAAEESSNGTSRIAWNHLNYPAILNWETEEVLWPEKWGWKELLQVRQDVGEDIFQAMYQQNPLPTSRRLARQEWLYGDDSHGGCIDDERTVGEGNPGRGTNPDIVRVISLDPSPTRYAALIVADINRGDQDFTADIIEIVRDKMSVRDMLEQLERVVRVYAPDYFIFEQNAAQRWLLQDDSVRDLRRKLTVLPHTTGRNKLDPVYGVESLATTFEFGRVRVPYGDAESRSMAKLLFEEATTYPQGLTDDVLMALWFMRANVTRLLPRSLSGGSRRGDIIKTPRHLKHGFGWANKKVGTLNG